MQSDEEKVGLRCGGPAVLNLHRSAKYRRMCNAAGCGYGAAEYLDCSLGGASIQLRRRKQLDAKVAKMAKHARPWQLIKYGVEKLRADGELDLILMSLGARCCWRAVLAIRVGVGFSREEEQERLESPI